MNKHKNGGYPYPWTASKQETRQSDKKIYVTNNYGLFKKMQGNRDVSPLRVDKIKKSIENVGYITSPIIVNEKMEIVDGQGRVRALKELGLPVEYIVHPGADINVCVQMNIHQTPWTLEDYLRSFAARGYSDYVYILKLYETFKGKVPLKVIACVCSNSFGFLSGGKIWTDLLLGK